MRFVLAMMVMAIGCGDDLDLAPDAANSGYPCSLEYERCRAALDLSEHACEWWLPCYQGEITRDECIAVHMQQYCGDGSCDVTPYDRADLDACLAEHEGATCREYLTCEL